MKDGLNFFSFQHKKEKNHFSSLLLIGYISFLVASQPVKSDDVHLIYVIKIWSAISIKYSSRILMMDLVIMRESFKYSKNECKSFFICATTFFVQRFWFEPLATNLKRENQFVFIIENLKRRKPVI